MIRRPMPPTPVGETATIEWPSRRLGGPRPAVRRRPPARAIRHRRVVYEIARASRMTTRSPIPSYRYGRPGVTGRTGFLGADSVFWGSGAGVGVGRRTELLFPMVELDRRCLEIGRRGDPARGFESYPRRRSFCESVSGDRMGRTAHSALRWRSELGGRWGSAAAPRALDRPPHRRATVAIPGLPSTVTVVYAHRVVLRCTAACSTCCAAERRVSVDLPPPILFDEMLVGHRRSIAWRRRRSRAKPDLRRRERACLRGVPAEPHRLETLDRLFGQGSVAPRETERA
jgi:hypothetical protein